jgi:hypothetical protein
MQVAGAVVDITKRAVLVVLEVVVLVVVLLETEFLARQT